MSRENLSETQLDDINETLTAGIETCRSVVANYKSLLAGDQGSAGQGTATETAETASDK